MNVCHQEGTNVWLFTETSDKTYERALGMVERGDGQGAILTLQELIDRDPAFLKAFLELGKAEYLLARECGGIKRENLLRDAECHLTKFVVSESSKSFEQDHAERSEIYGEAHYALGLVLSEAFIVNLALNEGRTEKAIWHFAAAIHRRRQFSGPYYYLAKWYMREGNFPEACTYAAQYLFHTRRSAKEHGHEREEMLALISSKGPRLIRVP